ncbi:hypothetical protein K7432_004483 [Basidiobolus ranarum]|uniref:Glutathione S-transferase n=1 Tax=Basidiobolus ranarum TaxID=34480 RepID=A0ABR2WY67_9FUNG
MAALPQPTQASSNHLSELTKNPDSSFKVLYYPIHGRADLIRTILAYSRAKWEDLAFDWPNQKEKTPYKCVPVVYEETKSGEVLQLAEQQAIERYLARKFGLLGENAWEEHQINELSSSIESLKTAFLQSLGSVAFEKRAEAHASFVLTKWAGFKEIHEALLIKNGSNGHYIGNKFSLADFKLANTIQRLEEWVPEGAQPFPVSASATPAIWKVYKGVNSHSSIATWRSSPFYEVLSEGTRKKLKI